MAKIRHIAYRATDVDAMPVKTGIQNETLDSGSR